MAGPSLPWTDDQALVRAQPFSHTLCFYFKRGPNYVESMRTLPFTWAALKSLQDDIERKWSRSLLGISGKRRSVPLPMPEPGTTAVRSPALDRPEATSMCAVALIPVPTGVEYSTRCELHANIRSGDKAASRSFVSQQTSSFHSPSLLHLISFSLHPSIALHFKQALSCTTYTTHHGSEIVQSILQPDLFPVLVTRPERGTQGRNTRLPDGPRRSVEG